MAASHVSSKTYYDSSYDSPISEYGGQEEEARPFLSHELQDAIKLEDRGLEDGCSSANAKTTNVTPLPLAQLGVLCTVRLVEPIMFTQIFPYVNEMMEHLHLTEDKSKTGLYSGIVESSFAIAQLLSIYHWARLSDKIGRKPVVLVGTTGIAIATVLMGFSRSLAGVLFARSLAGFFSGNIAVVHSVLGEITDPSNQAIAFPVYGLCWPLGSIIGPLLGGSFSNPAIKYPALFDTDLFRTFPYLLPSLIAASLAALGAIFGLFFLEESHPTKRRRRQAPSSPIDGFVGHEKPPEAAGIKFLLSIPIIRALCLSGSSLAFMHTGFEVIFVLYCYSPIRTGGLAFTAAEIGVALATSGAISAALQLFFMPYLLRRFNHVKMYNTLMSIWPYAFLILPGLNAIARFGSVEGEDGVLVLEASTKALLWVCIYAQLSLVRTACLAYSVSMILVKDSAPDPSSLGGTNGLAQFSMCFARAFSPAFASSLFAFSASFAFWPLRYSWVLVMVLLAVCGTRLGRRIVDVSKGVVPRRS